MFPSSILDMLKPTIVAQPEKKNKYTKNRNCIHGFISLVSGLWTRNDRVVVEDRWGCVRVLSGMVHKREERGVDEIFFYLNLIFFLVKLTCFIGNEDSPQRLYYSR